MNNAVTAWHEKIIIPTYGIGKPEKNPIFLEKRFYQGSSGVVYPHAVIEKVEDEKFDKEYQAIFIENEFIKIMILPELGGRVQRAFDKIRNRDFVYYNQVIKPALVGLTGPWISGGIEFNWPQHHRPSTFEPIDFTIEENKDGSKTVWVNEVEKMFRTKCMTGFTLYTDRAYLELKVRFYNRTPFPQTFLWWSNPAVKVNDHYQSVFPPDVYAVYDHGKRDVSDFPIATGTYYKVNYSPGTDLSMYKNIPVPTSFMAAESKYNFIGGYEHDTQGGMLHVANHHVSTGKKQWTWGNGDFGKAWDRNLTDEDGPYIELMCGAYTDNQPDFSWMQPFEEKSFEEYFMPYAEIGLVKNASKEAAINIECNGNAIMLAVYATAVYKNSVVQLFIKDILVKEILIDLSPQKIYHDIIHFTTTFYAEEIKVIVKDNKNNVLISYQPEVKIEHEIPPPAKVAKYPTDIETTELLYLNGLHLEQYRHATFSPASYYQEALKRDAGDARNNNAMGLLLLRKGKALQAEPYFQNAIKRISERNSNPYDGEAFYNWGLCLKMQNKLNGAYSSFYKATWNDAWQHSSFFQLTRIACIKNDFTDALYLINKSLLKNYHSHSARHLKVAILRKNGNNSEAIELINYSLTIDRFNYGCLFEKYLIAKDSGDINHSTEILTGFKNFIRDSFNNYQEYAIDYMQAGMYIEAVELLQLYAETKEETSPLLNYYLAFLYTHLNNAVQANTCFQKAAQCSPDYCFPNKIEDVMVLELAVTINPGDAKALYYLGNYWYANKEYEDAIAFWKKSMYLDNSFATVQRNLSLAYYNKLKKPAESLSLLKKAFELDTTDARVLMELDQLYKIQNYPHEKRLMLLEKYISLVEQRDDLYLERITIYNKIGNYEKAKDLIATRQFHPWEGGEGKVVYQFLLCTIEIVKKALLKGRNHYALQLLDELKNYPSNLGEGKLYGTQENEIYYLKGCAYEALGLIQKAKEEFIDSTKGSSEPPALVFHEDHQPVRIFYQGLAWIKLGDNIKANQIFERLVSFGMLHDADKIEIDYFTLSLPDLLIFEQDLQTKNIIYCKYLIGLGMLGLGKEDIAMNNFNRILELDNNHLGAGIQLGIIDFLKQFNKANRNIFSGQQGFSEESKIMV